jgi:hypothetical protein
MPSESKHLARMQVTWAFLRETSSTPASTSPAPIICHTDMGSASSQ